MSSELAVTLVCDERCFDLPEWPLLLEGDPNRHVFQSPEWNRVWWEAFSQDKDILVLVMKRGGDLAALVPLYRKVEDGRRVLRFVGGIELTDYLGPICSLGDRDDVAAALVGWLSDTPVEWDELDAHNMPVPFGFAEYLVDQADRSGFVFKLEQEEVSGVLPLSGDWEAHLSSLDQKDRHELRRKLRRLRREHPEARVRTATEQTLKDDLGTFIALHRRSEGSKRLFMTPAMASFFAAVARTFLDRGWLRLDLLEEDGRALAATFAFEVDGRFYLYNSAFEPEARRLSPGVVLVAELVRRSFEAGLDTFDFLRGSQRYKYGLGAQPVPLNNVRVLNQPS